MATQALLLFFGGIALAFILGLLLGWRISNISQKDVDKIRHDSFLQGFKAGRYHK